jgi:hypothetical protein
MDEQLGQTTFLGVALVLASTFLLADDPIDGTPALAPAGGEAMKQVLGRTTKPVTSPPGLVFGVAMGVAATLLVIGTRPLLGGIPRPPPPPAACQISGPAGYRTLDYTDSLENCGVQLEAVWLENGDPVSGAYNDLRLFVDDQGIDTAQAHGPRERLIAPWMRVQIDNELHRLMRARDREPMQIGVVHLGS